MEKYADRGTNQTNGMVRAKKVIKVFKSPDYNFFFNMRNGFFARWGRNEKDDPEYAPSPEILDIEISTICSKACKFCYKSNGTYQGKNMSFEIFKTMFDKFPKKTLTQIAFGIGDINGNPDLWKIMEYTRMNGVIPNITINGERMTDGIYDQLVNLCGAVAVSHYDDDTCYNAVYELNKRGLKQVNIHQLLSSETYDQCRRLMIDSKHDRRLKGLNATVFLMMKPKGKRNTLHKVNKEAYQDLVNYALDNSISIGFDSCSAPVFLKAVEHRDRFEEFKVMAESCESFGLFSGYVNVDAKYFPCSFAEGVGEWQEGLDVLNCDDFVKDIWNHSLLDKYRKRSLAEIDCNGCRKCLIYDLALEK